MIDPDHYPEIPSTELPYGIFVLVQLKRPRTKTKGGILLTGDTQDTDQYMTDRGIIRAIGSMAFHYSTGETWPGIWPQVGDEVRVPLYGGTTFFSNENDPEYRTKWGLFKHSEILSKFNS